MSHFNGKQMLVSNVRPDVKTEHLLPYLQKIDSTLRLILILKTVFRCSDETIVCSNAMSTQRTQCLLDWSVPSVWSSLTFASLHLLLDSRLLTSAVRVLCEVSGIWSQTFKAIILILNAKRFLFISNSTTLFDKSYRCLKIDRIGSKSHFSRQTQVH